MLKRNSGGTVSPKQRHVCVRPNTLNSFASSQNCSAAVSLGDAIGLCYTSLRCSLILVYFSGGKLAKNGLCLCVFHDRAFEVGAFTLDSSLKVELHDCDRATEWAQLLLANGAGKNIKDSKIRPTKEMLEHHWKRHGIKR
jgi:hypothetical protein